MDRPHRLVVEWRHLDLGNTPCGRCTDTGTNLWNVITRLGEENLLDGVELELQNTVLPIERVMESNTVLINGVQVEQILGLPIPPTDCRGCPDPGGKPGVCPLVDDDRDLFSPIPEEMLRAAILKALNR